MNSPGRAEHRIRPERQRVEIVVVDPAVDHVDAPQPAGCAHIDEAVPGQQVAALHQFDAHLAGQEHVLVEGRVVDPRGQQDDDGIGVAARREFGKGLAEQPAVILNPAHAMAPEHVAEAGFHRLPVGQHVGHAGGHAQIVLQNQEAVMGPDQVGSADRDICVVEHLHAAHRDPELRTAADQIGRDDPVGNYPARTVDIREEQVQRFEPLAQTAFEEIPFFGGDQPRDDIDRDDALLRAFLAIDGKSDALVQEGPLRALLHRGDLVPRRLAESLPQLAAMGARRAGGVEHFIIESGVRLVAGEQMTLVRRAAGSRLFGRHRLILVRC